MEAFIQITGAPFTIRFHDLFFRDPANPQECDLVWSIEDLEEYARSVFQSQGFLEMERWV